MPKRRRNGRHSASSFAREEPSRDSRKVVLFSCEGRETERRYVKALCAELGLAPAQFAALGGDPSHVVERAVVASSRDAEDARAGYDAIWCVFDRDQHEHFADACQRAEDCGLGVAHSNPCFELWFLLHLKRSAKPLTREQAQKRWKKHFVDYTKSTDVYERLRDKQDDALKNARSLREHHAKLGQSTRENPSTSVDQMILALRQLTEPNRGAPVSGRELPCGLRQPPEV